MNHRYAWQAKCIPPRHELFDRVCLQAIAIIVFDGESQQWEWTRFTTRYQHGAPPLQGATAADLQTAKTQVLEGLPGEVRCS